MRRLHAGFVVLGLAMAALVVASAAQGSNSQAAVDVQYVQGAATCPADTSRGGSFTLDPVANGTYNNGWLSISGATATSFDWAFTATGKDAVDAAVVIVQGGGQSAIYTYDYLTTGRDDAGANLAAAGNAPITKAIFCYDDKQLRDLINAGGGGSGGGGSSGGGGGGGGGGGVPADLAVTGIVSPVTPKVGDTMVWRINVLDKNNAPSTGLKVQITLQGNHEYAEGKTDRGPGCKSTSATTVTCDLDYLSGDSPVGGIVLLTVAKGTGDFKLTAIADGQPADPNPSDNTLNLIASTLPPSAATRAGATVGSLTAATQEVRATSTAQFHVFRTSVSLTKAATLTLFVEDAKTRKRVVLQAGSKAGRTVVGKAGTKVLKTAVLAKGVRPVVLRIKVADLSNAVSYRLRVLGTSPDGKAAGRLIIPLAW